jgi:nucleoside-diphosphate-sugar epimerase
MNILLLGGNGYIGSKFYSTIKDKHTVKSIDLCLFQKDLGYSERLNFDSVDTTEYDIIYCLAGHSSVPMCEHSPSRSWINNVNYFANLCEKLTSKQKLIYASSASVYGAGSEMSSENSPINFNPLNHYDLQKITLDLIANRHVSAGKKIIGLRFGTVNGASPNTRSELMLNSMMKSAIETKKVIAKNLNIRRAILGISDLSRVLNKLVYTEIESGQYNVSSFNSTVYDLAMSTSNKTNAELVIVSGDTVAYDFELNTDKIQKALDFEFTNTVDSICEELQNTYNELNFDNRSDDRNFRNYI